MSRYVLDSSVAVKWVIPEQDSAQALALQDAVRNGIHEIIAPEVAHALSSRVSGVTNMIGAPAEQRFMRTSGQGEKHTTPSRCAFGRAPDRPI